MTGRQFSIILQHNKRGQKRGLILLLVISFLIWQIAFVSGRKVKRYDESKRFYGRPFSLLYFHDGGGNFVSER
jgi:hypothetical protein